MIKKKIPSHFQMCLVGNLPSPYHIVLLFSVPVYQTLLSGFKKVALAVGK